jgi:uncharacterized protein YjbI with pentapeptide repeats
MEIRNAMGVLLFSCEGRPGCCDLDGLNLQNADLRGKDLTGMLISDTDFSFADVRGASFYWDPLIDVRFEGANLEGTDLAGTDLIRVNFRSANLRNADLGPSGLGGPPCVFGCDFTGANLEGTIFTEAQYDEDTRLPEGVDKAKWGMTFRSRAEWQPKPSTPPSP